MRCDALAVLTERPSAEKPPKNPDTREKKDVLCKVWARGDTCTTKNCPYRHAFRDAFEETWGRRLRSRRDHDLKQDAADPFAAYDKHANRNAWRFVPGDDNRKRRHAARHVEFGAWIVDRFGRSLLEAGPVLDVAGGRGQLAWELQCVHGLRAVSLDPRTAKVPRKSRRKLLRKLHLRWWHAGVTAMQRTLKTAGLPNEVLDMIPDIIRTCRECRVWSPAGRDTQTSTTCPERSIKSSALDAHFNSASPSRSKGLSVATSSAASALKCSGATR